MAIHATLAKASWNTTLSDKGLMSILELLDSGETDQLLGLSLPIRFQVHWKVAWETCWLDALMSLIQMLVSTNSVPHMTTAGLFGIPARSRDKIAVMKVGSMTSSSDDDHDHLDCQDWPLMAICHPSAAAGWVYPRT